MSRPFHEILLAKQTPGEPRVRWWQSDYFDLFIWFEPDEEIWGFQLCYDRTFDEHALTWRREFGILSHHSVDDGQRSMGHARSPILGAAYAAIPHDISRRFEEEGATLPAEFRSLVAGVLATSATARN